MRSSISLSQRNSGFRTLLDGHQKQATEKTHEAQARRGGIAHDLLAAGIFEKHRVNATSIYIDSESLMNHAIAGGSIQFTTSWIIFQ